MRASNPWRTTLCFLLIVGLIGCVWELTMAFFTSEPMVQILLICSTFLCALFATVMVFMWKPLLCFAGIVPNMILNGIIQVRKDNGDKIVSTTIGTVIGLGLMGFFVWRMKVRMGN